MSADQANCAALIIEGLYNRHHGWLYQWLRQKLRCPEQAADTAQDTFLRLFGFTGIHAIKEPRALLVTTATRLVIDHSRRRKIEQRYLELWAQESPDDACAPSPEDLSIIADALLAIAYLLDDLPANVRQAFLHARLDGLKHAEIAERMGVSVSSVKKYIATAMVQIHQRLDQDRIFGA